MKREYIRPSIEIYKIEIANGILTGSIIEKPVKVESVTVEEYKDGFEAEGGFKDIYF